MVIFFVLIGLYLIIAAAADWDWFINHRKAQLFVRLFTRNGARIFYIILGLGFLTMGILTYLGVIHPS